MSGRLYVCATPIGNLEDVTFRVIRQLREVDLIAAEDTRHSVKLLNHYNVKTPMTSYHEHNKIQKANYLVERMLNGEDVALITDAGTPGISDPGEELVRMAYEAGILVDSLPGASACITALAVSGLPTGRFAFEAFLPLDKKKRRWVLDVLKTETRTIVIYEAPHRLIRTLRELYEALGERTIALCKELTKKYERIERGRISEILTRYEETEPKGEFVIVIEGRSKEDLTESRINQWRDVSIEEHMDAYLNEGMEKKEAMKRVASDRGLAKRDVYKELLAIKKAP